MGAVISKLWPGKNRSTETDAQKPRSSTPIGKEKRSSLFKSATPTPAIDIKPEASSSPDHVDIPNLSSEPRPALRPHPRTYTTTFETTIVAQPIEARPGSMVVEEAGTTDGSGIDIDASIVDQEDQTAESAAIKIQAGVRGFLARQNVKQMKRDASPNAALSNHDFDEAGGAPIVPPPPSFGDPVTSHVASAINDATNQTLPAVQNETYDPLGVSTTPLSFLGNTLADIEVIDTTPTVESGRFRVSPVPSADAPRTPEPCPKLGAPQIETTTTETTLHTVQSLIEEIPPTEKDVVQEFKEKIIETTETVIEKVTNIVEDLPKTSKDIIAQQQAAISGAVADVISRPTQPSTSPPKKGFAEQFREASEPSFAKAKGQTDETLSFFTGKAKELVHTVQETSKSVAEQIAKKEEELIVASAKIESNCEQLKDICQKQAKEIKGGIDLTLDKSVNQIKEAVTMVGGKAANEIDSIKNSLDIAKPPSKPSSPSPDISEDEVLKLAAEAESEAAVKIQAAYRGFKTRKDFAENKIVFPEKTKKGSEQDNENEQSIIENIENQINAVTSQIAAAPDLFADLINPGVQPAVVESVSNLTANESATPEVRVTPEPEEAAVKIQAAFRGYQVRKSMSREASPRRPTEGPDDSIAEQEAKSQPSNKSDDPIQREAVEILDQLDEDLIKQLEDRGLLDITKNMPTIEIRQPSFDANAVKAAAIEASAQLSAHLESVIQSSIDSAMAVIKESNEHLRKSREHLESISAEPLSSPALVQQQQQKPSEESSDLLTETAEPELMAMIEADEKDDLMSDVVKGGLLAEEQSAMLITLPDSLPESPVKQAESPTKRPSEAASSTAVAEPLPTNEMLLNKQNETRTISEACESKQPAQENSSKSTVLEPCSTSEFDASVPKLASLEMTPEKTLPTSAASTGDQSSATEINTGVSDQVANTSAPVQPNQLEKLKPEIEPPQERRDTACSIVFLEEAQAEPSTAPESLKPEIEPPQERRGTIVILEEVSAESGHATEQLQQKDQGQLSELVKSALNESVGSAVEAPQLIADATSAAEQQLQTSVSSESANSERRESLIDEPISESDLARARSVSRGPSHSKGKRRKKKKSANNDNQQKS